ncbi:MAG TPA: threonine synthase [Pirellulaceae bacterium]|nr:threonine synthase [Pirellulaceae bacterium]
MTRWVTTLEGAIDGTPLDPDRSWQTHADRPILVRYDLPKIRATVDRGSLDRREGTMWRWRELLPVGDEPVRVSLGESITPLLDAPRLGARLGLDRLKIKDESTLPTGSFKARGLAMAIEMARRFGHRRVALPTAGNAGGAAAAYAARAGIDCVVLMPRDVPIVNRLEAEAYGAKVLLVDGLINDCGKLVFEGRARYGWFDLSTLKEPYRLEGKKTMGLELARQCDWRLPDAIFYPTGGGTGLIGMWKGFRELAELGWLDHSRLPKLYAVQSRGCAPIVTAWEAGERFARPFPDAATVASGLRVPVAVGDFLMIDALRESGGRAIGVPEEELIAAERAAMRDEGISICPETAACLIACRSLVESGELARDAEVVVFNTGAAQKYVEALACESRRFDGWESVDRLLADQG